ncbi:MAG: hypothetical protein WBP12_01400 [Candidatus Saccharimonas sp.]
MDSTSHLAKKLQDFLELEGNKSREEIAAYIVGELVGDYDGLYTELLKNDVDVVRIADLASDLEWSNGSTDELVAMWEELERLINKLAERLS